MVDGLNIVGGITVLGVVTLTVISVVGGYSEWGSPRLEQITEIGQNYEQWAITNPKESTIPAYGKSYNEILNAVLGREAEPIEGLENKTVFYLLHNDERYGLCISETFDNAGREKLAYIYSTVTEKTVRTDDCVLDPP